MFFLLFLPLIQGFSLNEDSSEHGHTYVLPLHTLTDVANYRFGDYHYQLGGDAMVVRDLGAVSLTREAESQSGYVQNSHPLTYANFRAWEVEMELEIAGKSKQFFGDGVAIWFTDSPEFKEGPVFGRNDHWKGLGIFFDTFDNGQLPGIETPYISAWANDGTKTYELGQGLGLGPRNYCQANFRYLINDEDNGAADVVNSDQIIRVKIQYDVEEKSLHVLTKMHTGEKWNMCIRLNQYEIPSGSYVAVSAKTGALVDHHRIYSIVTKASTVPVAVQHKRQHDDILNLTDAAEEKVVVADNELAQVNHLLGSSHSVRTIKELTDTHGSMIKSLGERFLREQEHFRQVLQGRIFKHQQATLDLYERIHHLERTLHNRLERSSTKTSLLQKAIEGAMLFIFFISIIGVIIFACTIGSSKARVLGR